VSEPSASATAEVRDARKCRRASGSSAATGSSSSSSRGRLASTSARATWARWPPDSVPTGRSRGMSSPRNRVRACVPSQRVFTCTPILMWSSAVILR
jgi:hypothetical protein